MKVTDVRIKKFSEDSEKAMKAVASITFDNQFVIHDIKVIEGNKGLFIAFPSKKGKDDNYIDIAHPINSEFRSEIQDAVLAKYNETSDEA